MRHRRDACRLRHRQLLPRRRAARRRAARRRAARRRTAYCRTAHCRAAHRRAARGGVGGTGSGVYCSGAHLRTPAHSFADAEGGGLVLRVEVPELTSMEAAELEVDGTGFILYVPQLYRLGPLAWPRPVDVDAAVAKLLKKRGVLQVTLPDVCV